MSTVDKSCVSNKNQVQNKSFNSSESEYAPDDETLIDRLKRMQGLKNKIHHKTEYNKNKKIVLDRRRTKQVQRPSKSKVNQNLKIEDSSNKNNQVGNPFSKNSNRS